MWALWILAAMISLVGYITVGNEIRNPVIATGTSADLAWNMGVYRAAVIGYVHQHPEFAGTVPDEALEFPAWYRRDARWKNTVAGGTIVVYASRPVAADVVTELAALSNHSLFVGTADAHAGRLVSVLRGMTELALPASIPHGVPVWMALVS